MPTINITGAVPGTQYTIIATQNAGSASPSNTISAVASTGVWTVTPNPSNPDLRIFTYAHGDGAWSVVDDPANPNLRTFTFTED